MTFRNIRVKFLMSPIKHLVPVLVGILSEHPEGQMPLMVFGTYAGRLSFFPLSTLVMYK